MAKRRNTKPAMAAAKPMEVKPAEVKETVAPAVAESAPAEEVKEEVKTEEVKTEEVKAEEVKVEVKEEVKAEPVKKTAAEKKTAAKTTRTTKKAVKEELKPEVFVQFQENEAVLAEVVDRIKAQFVAEGHRESSIKSLQIYLKPEDYAAYYVINQKIQAE